MVGASPLIASADGIEYGWCSRHVLRVTVPSGVGVNALLCGIQANSGPTLDTSLVSKYECGYCCWYYYTCR